jgi:NAD(P)-dependent dehydrogenase (short-subunit alcohol dehydrogenase family)
MIDVHLCGAFYCIRYEITAMLKSGGGAIVVKLCHLKEGVLRETDGIPVFWQNVSSVAGQVALGPTAAYVAAKHGVIGLTRTAALEYTGKGVRINGTVSLFKRLLQKLD